MFATLRQESVYIHTGGLNWLFINLLINVVPLIETLHEQIVFKCALFCTIGILFEDMPVFIKKFNVFGQMEHALFACIELIQVFLKEDINE